MPGRAAPARARPRHAGAPAAPARPRRGAPLRDHPSPHAPRQGDDDVDPRRPARHRAVAQARAAQPLRLARGVPGRLARGARGGARACPARRRASSTASCTRRALSHRSQRPSADRSSMAVSEPRAPERPAVRRLQPRGPRGHHGLLGRGQVDGDGRVRGRRLLLRRQPAAGDDPLARRAVHARGLEGRARGGRLRRARRRLLRGAARGARRPRPRWASRTASCSSTPTSRRCSTATRRRAGAIRWRRRRASPPGSPPSARCSAPLKERADLVIDTTGLKAAQLRRRIADELLPRQRRGRLAVTFQSFGFKHGPPRDADLVFDVRFLPNPHYVPELRPLTGHDPRVVEYVGREGKLDEFYERLDPAAGLPACPQYQAEGKAHLDVAIGCTGGRHRSVAIAEHLGRALPRPRRRRRRGRAPRRRPRPSDRLMLDHVGFEVSDLARSARFYDALFVALGGRRIARVRAGDRLRRARAARSGSSRAGAPPRAGLRPRRDRGRGARRGRRRLRAPALAAGGRDDGAPGPRPQYGPRYYAAYLLDPDGLRVEVVSGGH